MIDNNQILPVPENFTIKENSGELQIEFKWDRMRGIIFSIFSIFWNGMLIYMMSTMPRELWFFLVLHGGVGLYVVHFGLSHLINKTLITCTSNTLKLNSGPIPNFNDRVISKEDISQLYFTEKVTTRRGRTSVTYRLHMLDRNNKSTRLIKSLPNPEAARFIEKKLEHFFKVKNLEVAGEFDKQK
jgi:hypothetical protein